MEKTVEREKGKRISSKEFTGIFAALVLHGAIYFTGIKYMDNLKYSLQLQQREIAGIESSIRENERLAAETLKARKESEQLFLIRRPEITVGRIFTFVDESRVYGTEYSNIDIQGEKIEVTGSSKKLVDIYALEKNLRRKGAVRVNSDYIKERTEGFDFSLDMELVPYE